jgi:hypothetical protein
VQCLEPFRGWFTEAAQRLNLDQHRVHGQVIYGPGDIEGHLGRVWPLISLLAYFLRTINTIA